jgi:hypothetical protein
MLFVTYKPASQREKRARERGMIAVLDDWGQGRGGSRVSSNDSKLFGLLYLFLLLKVMHPSSNTFEGVTRYY